MKLLHLRFNDGKPHTNTEEQYLRDCEDVLNAPENRPQLLRALEKASRAGRDLLMFGSSEVIFDNPPQ